MGDVTTTAPACREPQYSLLSNGVCPHQLIACQILNPHFMWKIHTNIVLTIVAPLGFCAQRWRFADSLYISIGEHSTVNRPKWVPSAHFENSKKFSCRWDLHFLQMFSCPWLFRWWQVEPKLWKKTTNFKAKRYLFDVLCDNLAPEQKHCDFRFVCKYNNIGLLVVNFRTELHL